MLKNLILHSVRESKLAFKLKRLFSKIAYKMRHTTKNQAYFNFISMSLTFLLIFGTFFFFKKSTTTETLEFNETATPLLVQDFHTKKETLKIVSTCFKEEFSSWKHLTTSLWLDIPDTVKKCTKIIANKIPYIEGTPDCLEHKYYMIPRAYHINESCSVIAFGIGGEIAPELHIKMSIPQCTFLGFDPNENFKDIYVNGLGGKFVHTAVGGKNGKSTIYKLKSGKYSKQPKTKMRSAAELIETYHGKDKIVDILNIDVEGSEYSIFEQLYKDEIFKNVCQINVELHPVWYHETGYSFFDVIKIFENLADDGTFVWIKSHIHATQFFPSYFINVKNNICIEKYLINRLL